MFHKFLKYNQVNKIWTISSCSMVKSYKINFSFLLCTYIKTNFLEFSMLFFCIKRYLEFLLAMDTMRLVTVTAGLQYKYMPKMETMFRDMLEKKTEFNIESESGNHRQHKGQVYVLFGLPKSTRLLLELKRRGLVLICFLDIRDNAKWIEYPILANTKYFYSMYFFCRLLFITKAIKKFSI